MPETTHVDYSTKIPNNVGLIDDQRVLKALEQWHPGYIDWWMTMGPDGFQTSDVYLRTAEWYRRGLRRYFRDLGSGFWLRRGVPLTVWDLESGS